MIKARFYINISSVICSAGKGTTHCTNGIVIQRKPLSCALPPETSNNQNRSKKRSISCISTDVLPYHSGPRQGPDRLEIDLTTIKQASPEIAAYARVIDFGWILCRMSIKDTLFSLEDNQRQVIPAWSGFNIKLREDSVPRECSVGYCQVIEASPTELPTVYTVLQRSLQMADQLGQHDVIVVFDQAIYAKALEVLGRTRTSFSDWLSGLAPFIPSVPSLLLLASDSEMPALQMFWLKVVSWAQDLWLELLKVVTTTELYVHIRYT